MLKGVGKQIVVIKNPKSKMFEEAIFIIKDGTTTAKTDMLEECEKIIRSSTIDSKRYRKNKLYTSLLILTISLIVLLGLVLIYVLK